MKPTCVHCGSDKEPYFSRSEPMGDYCSECGHNFYERPTPETDAFWDGVCESWSNWSVNEGHEKLLELARRLERERDTERALADRLAECLSYHAEVDGEYAPDTTLAALTAWKEARSE